MMAATTDFNGANSRAAAPGRKRRFTGGELAHSSGGTAALSRRRCAAICRRYLHHFCRRQGRRNTHRRRFPCRHFRTEVASWHPKWLPRHQVVAINADRRRRWTRVLRFKWGLAPVGHRTVALQCGATLPPYYGQYLEKSEPILHLHP